MNREIRFRGLDIMGNWHYGLIANPLVDTDGGAKKNHWYISNSMNMPFAYEVRKETIGQSTGLKDKNGKEIYESDLVKCPVSGKSSEYLQLEAGKKDFVIRTISIPEVYMEGLPDDCEVIGNSFENPNLLNKRNENKEEVS